MILREIYADTKFLEITPESREEAVRRTGLRWDQVYKWLYDRRKTLKLPAPVFIPLPSESGSLPETGVENRFVN